LKELRGEDKRKEKSRGGEKLKGSRRKLCVKLKKCEMCESVKRRAEAQELRN